MDSRRILTKQAPQSPSLEVSHPQSANTAGSITSTELAMYMTGLKPHITHLLRYKWVGDKQALQPLFDALFIACFNRAGRIVFDVQRYVQLAVHEVCHLPNLNDIERKRASAATGNRQTDRARHFNCSLNHWRHNHQSHYAEVVNLLQEWEAAGRRHIDRNQRNPE